MNGNWISWHLDLPWLELKGWGNMFWGHFQKKSLAPITVTDHIKNLSAYKIKILQSDLSPGQIDKAIPLAHKCMNYLALSWASVRLTQSSSLIFQLVWMQSSGTSKGDASRCWQVFHSRWWNCHKFSMSGRVISQFWLMISGIQEWKWSVKC